MLCALLSLSLAPPEPDEVEEMLQRHVRWFRDNAPYKDAYIVLYAENNMSFIGSKKIAQQLQDFGKILVVTKSDSKRDIDRVGVHTGHNEKEAYKNRMAYLLQYGHIAFAKRFNSATAQVCKDALVEQMINFKEVWTPATSAHGKPKITWCGKQGGRKDDLVLATQIGIHWSIEQQHDKKYIELSQKMGWREAVYAGA